MLRWELKEEIKQLKQDLKHLKKYEDEYNYKSVIRFKTELLKVKKQEYGYWKKIK